MDPRQTITIAASGYDAPLLVLCWSCRWRSA